MPVSASRVSESGDAQRPKVGRSLVWVCYTFRSGAHSYQKCGRDAQRGSSANSEERLSVGH
eukprot:7226353-Pyramimonas_sp.AAC.1